MARTINVPEREYTPGHYEVELKNIPSDVEEIRLVLTRVASNPSGNLASVNLYMRVNNAAPWNHVMGNTFAGGTMLDRNGDLMTTSIMTFTWPGEADGNGQRVKRRGSDVKFEADVLQTFRTAVTVEGI